MTGRKVELKVTYVGSKIDIKTLFMGFLCPLVTFYKVPLRQLFASDFIGTFHNGARAFMKSHLYLSLFLSLILNLYFASIHL